MIISTWQKLLGILIYLIPWSDIIPFGYNLFYNFPITKLLIIPAFPIIFINQIIPFGRFLIFIILFLTIVRNPKVSYFLRFNCLQAILISIMVTIINFGFQIFIFPIGTTLIARTFSTTILISIISIVTFCIIECIKGLEPNLPLISDAVKMQV